MNPQTEQPEQAEQADIESREVHGRTVDLADAGRLAALIARLCATPPSQRLECAVQEIVRLLGGEAGISLVQGDAHVPVGSQARSQQERMDLERCPGLKTALESSLPVDLPLTVPDEHDGGAPGVCSDLLRGPGQLTAVPLGAGFEPSAWVLVRNADRNGDEINRATARVAGAIAGAIIWPQRTPISAMPPVGRAGDAEAASLRSFRPTPVWGLRAVPADGARRVVVVEDDPDVAGGLRAALESEGYEVEMASTADQALATLRHTPPSLVILDISLPDGDGFGIARALAAHRRTAQVPVLFLSGVEDLATRVRSLHRDEADFLRKPFAWKELLTRVEQSILRAEHRDQLLFSARTDALTGLANRRMLEERLATEAARLDRYGTPLSLTILDVDGLKGINDRHGHAAGSAVLRAVGEALLHAVRETDLAARYGGDEFVVLLPHTDLEHARAFAERVLTTLRSLRPSGLPVSVSIGVAAYEENRDASVEDLFQRADQAAYRAKRDGGNRVYLDKPAT